MLHVGKVEMRVLFQITGNIQKWLRKMACILEMHFDILAILKVG